MLDISAVLKIRGFKVFVPGEEGLGEVAASSAFLENELRSAGEEMLDVFLC
jgi:hypothetical protein